MTGKLLISRAVFAVLLGASISLSASTSARQPAKAGAEPRFRLAIIGLVHSHAWGYLRNIASLPEVELVGIAEPNAALRAEAAKAAPGIALYEDYHKLLAEKKPEGVWAFVENDRHLEI